MIESSMMKNVKTSFTLRGVEFANRVFVASGTFGYGDEIPDLVRINRLGGIITKSLSWNPRSGNPPPRIVETADGMAFNNDFAGLSNLSFKHAVFP